MIKKTLLVVTISTTLISGVAFAAEGNDTGVLTSATTAPSVGYRPVAVAGEEGLEVKGKLYIGQTLRIDKLFYTDKDGESVPLKPFTQCFCTAHFATTHNKNRSNLGSIEKTSYQRKSMLTMLVRIAMVGSKQGKQDSDSREVIC